MFPMNQLFLSAAVALAACLSLWSVFKVAAFLTHIGQGLFATKAGQSLWKLRYLAGLLLGMWLLEIPPLFSGGPYTPIPRVRFFYYFLYAFSWCMCYYSRCRFVSPACILLWVIVQTDRCLKGILRGSCFATRTSNQGSP